jgi:N-acetylglucosamine-6-phosphate deacetylase
MEIALCCKGIDNIVLITDNVPLTGMPNRIYKDELGQEIIKDDEKAQIAGWTLAGSVSPLNRNVYNIVNRPGHSLSTALQLSTVNPARLIGVEHRKGCLRAGMDADLVIIDDQVRVYATIVKGRFVYEALVGRNDVIWERGVARWTVGRTNGSHQRESRRDPE